MGWWGKISISTDTPTYSPQKTFERRPVRPASPNTKPFRALCRRAFCIVGALFCPSASSSIVNRRVEPISKFFGTIHSVNKTKVALWTLPMNSGC